jgi:hypothetical protein
LQQHHILSELVLKANIFSVLRYVLVQVEVPLRFKVLRSGDQLIRKKASRVILFFLYFLNKHNICD